MTPIDPSLVGALQARYGEILNQIADRFIVAVRTAVDSNDWFMLREILNGAESTTADLTSVHLELLTGIESPTDTTAQSLAGETLTMIAADPENAVALVSDFVHSTAAAESQRFNEATGAIRYWIRVTTPGEICGLCVLAATRVYKTANLQPIHGNCRCTVQPLLTSVTEHKRNTLPLADQVDRDLAAAEAKNGRTRTAKQSRSRASNVRVTTPDTN